MTARRDPDQLIHRFLLEGSEQLHDQVYDAVRAEIDQKRQRVVIGPWRLLNMNKLAPLGVAAAVVIIALVAGSRLLGPPAPGGVGTAPSVRPSVAPSATPGASLDTTPSPTVWTGLPQGSYVVTGASAPVAVSVEIASPGWTTLLGLDAMAKNDDGRDPPESLGAALLAWGWPAGTGFNVYGDPCEWSTTTPDTPATTPDQIAAALAAQATTDATAPVDVTIGGFAGKAITLRVPMSFFVTESATREEEFAACDKGIFGFFGAVGELEPSRDAQGPGQIDELWILDVDGAIVVLDAALSPATPPGLVEETRALARSATFKAP